MKIDLYTWICDKKTYIDCHKLTNSSAYDFCITDKMSRLLHIESHNLQYCDILLHSGSAVIPYFKYFSTDAYTSSVSERPVRYTGIFFSSADSANEINSSFTAIVPE